MAGNLIYALVPKGTTKFRPRNTRQPARNILSVPANVEGVVRSLREGVSDRGGHL